MINVKSITLVRNRSRIVNNLRNVGLEFLFIFILIASLFAIITIKTFETKIGYEIARTNAILYDLSNEHKRLQTKVLILKSHERIKSIAILNGMKFPGQQDVEEINNE